jgi:hypothetical protein
MECPMATKEIFEWTFSPTDYFEQALEIQNGNYSMVIAEGKIEARMSSEYFAANPQIREQLHSIVLARFQGALVNSFLPYELMDPIRTHLREDGGKDVFVEPKGAVMYLFGGTADIIHTRGDGTVVYDSRAERILEKRTLGELVEVLQPSDLCLRKMLVSLENAVRDPKNELVHLYEIRDALTRKFGGDGKAKKILRISASAWSKFGKICNDEPLRQGRHRGKAAGPLRNPTHVESEEARVFAKEMVKKYVYYLSPLGLHRP